MLGIKTNRQREIWRKLQSIPDRYVHLLTLVGVNLNTLVVLETAGKKASRFTWGMDFVFELISPSLIHVGNLQYNL